MKQKKQNRLVVFLNGINVKSDEIFILLTRRELKRKEWNGGNARAGF